MEVNFNELKVPDVIVGMSFDLTGMAGLNRENIAGFSFSWKNGTQLLHLRYYPEKDFPLKSLMIHGGYTDFDTDNALLQMFGQDGKHLFIIDFNNLKLCSMEWSARVENTGMLVLELEYSIGRMA